LQVKRSDLREVIDAILEPVALMGRGGQISRQIAAHAEHHHLEMLSTIETVFKSVPSEVLLFAG
jgi:glycerol dehydrogenase-like iron-containing ADH family enzyme